MNSTLKRYAFYFDSAACTGCKTCQAACKDKNDLPVGVLWRRVYEVTGGGWTRRGDAWATDVFAYQVSLACNHCEQPICAEVCPASAYDVRADGLVLLNPERCLGCKYCSWACPYGAPQYNERAGHMTKCDFCADLVEAGKPPACVAACPMRVLDFGDRAELEARHGSAATIFPLPPPALTGPSLVITPHRDASRAASEPAAIGNREEVGR